MLEITTDCGDFVITLTDETYGARVSQNGDGQWHIEAYRARHNRIERDTVPFWLHGIPSLTATADQGIEAAQKAIRHLIASDISDLQKLLDSTDEIPVVWTAAKETEPVKAIFAYLQADAEPMGDPACYPSDDPNPAETPEVDGYGDPYPTIDAYPTLAERLAESMKDDRAA